MNRLKICDLSFCEAELSSFREVEGGTQEVSIYLSESCTSMSLFSAKLGKYSTKLGKPSLKDYILLGEYTVEKFGDENTGNYGYVVSNKEGNVVAGTAVGHLDNGSQYATSFSTVST